MRSRRSLASLCLVGAAAGSAGVASPALLAIGIGVLLLPWAAWLLLVSSARRVVLERSVVSCEVQEGSVVRMNFTVRVAPWLPVRVEVEDHLGGWLDVDRGRGHLELRVPRPGIFCLSPSVVRLRDATGAFERRLAAGRPERLLVLPAPQRGSIVRRPQCGLAGDPEPEGLRPYVPGTPLVRMHWPTFAKSGELQVRHFAPPPSRLPLVVIEIGQTSRLEALDWLLRTAAGQVLELAQTGGCCVLLPGETNPTSVVGVGPAWWEVHRRLATLAGASASDRPRPALSGAAIHLRATDAPVTLPPAPALPNGLQPAA